MTNFFLFCRSFKASITTPTVSYDRFRLQVTPVFAAPAAAAALMAVVFLLSVDFCGAVSLSESAARASVSHGAAGVNVTAARSVNAPRAVMTTLSVSDAEKLHNRVQASLVISNSFTRRVLAGSCESGNPIDDCWRCDLHWEQNRKNLADCAVGFGANAIGGKNGHIYVVTDENDNDAINPVPGTLRYGVLQEEPLWIVFSRSMMISLKQELMINSYKTIDGRGHNVHIAGGACLTVQNVHSIIIHGVHIHHCKRSGPAVIRSSPTHYGQRGPHTGTAVSIFSSYDIWVDHCFFSTCADSLVDVVMGSTDITISNNYFTNQDEVMLLGGRASDIIEQDMHVTVAFNHFGPGLLKNMPRCRHGNFHIVNNDYTSWGMYAVGGSEAPTINSEGNRYLAPNTQFAKEITKRIEDDGGDVGTTDNWNWRSSGDLFLNGAYFTNSGASSTNADFYAKATSFSAHPVDTVASMTADAGPLKL